MDKRADIWAFGVVVFEMLTGRRLFDGETVSDTLAAVLTKDMDWSPVPATTPAPVRQLLRRCLDRDPTRRLRDIGEARVLLGDPGALMAPAALHDRPARSRLCGSRRRLRWRWQPALDFSWAGVWRRLWRPRW